MASPTCRSVSRAAVSLFALGCALAFLLALSAVFAPAAALDVPFLSGRVVDGADIVPPDAEARITRVLEALEDSTGVQVAVLTVPSLEGEVLEDWSLHVAETWQLGRKGKDDGILFLVAVADRKMRIEVGYGLEGFINDARAGRVLREVVQPRFRAGDFGGGIEAGIDAILQFLRGVDPLPPEGSGGTSLRGGERAIALLFVLFVLGVFSLIAVNLPLAQGLFLYLFLMPFYLVFPGAIVSWKAGVFSFLAWVVGFWILRVLFQNSNFGRTLSQSMRSSGGRGWGGGGWSSGGGGWSGGGGGGGFSGGGGSFGGGGSSGSW